jgi:hypothetical protein
MVDRHGTHAKASVVHLIRWVADDYVELHMVSKDLGSPSLYIVSVDEGVRMRFERIASVQR